MKNKFRRYAGFTLMELIVVFALIGIFLAVAVPSMLDFVETGKQRNRMNIARTIYLAAQNQLTEQRITKNLKAGLVGEYYDNINGKYVENADALKANKNVYKSLNNYLPSTEIGNGNENYIHYISKPKGVNDPEDPVVKLLDPVILDKMILDDAILIEYNIKTGAVLSVFYGDILKNNEQFEYSGDGSGRDILGVRLYENAADRRQGYYGTTDTGTIDDDIQPTLINIYDSYTRGLPDDTFHDFKNILYAEILIPQKLLNSNFDLLINDDIVESGIPLDVQTKSIMSLYQALLTYNSNSNTALIYRYDGNINENEPPGREYARIIWVLDYVGGDMSVGMCEHSIGVKYASKITVDGNKNLRVGINGNASAVSFTEANPYFYTGNQGSYSGDRYCVMSARHLYNIRYLEYGHFVQKDDIDLSEGIPVTNFAPIPEFSGTYSGEGHAVQNIDIHLPSEDNVGLFGRITEKWSLGLNSYMRASVTGLTLENPNIIGGANTGSVCGVLNGYITWIYVKYTDENKSIRGRNNVGGIIGYNAGMITDSTFISPTAREHIFGTDKDTTGGIAGNSESGKLQRILFLAVAPKNDTVINPITGNGNRISGINNKLYYLSGTAIRPDEVPIYSGEANYNTEASNGTGEGMGTDELYETAMGSAWARSVSGNGSLIDEEIVSPYNTIYPYPFVGHSESGIATYPNWPIAEKGKQVSNIIYYELYNDNTWGYSSDNTLASSNSSKIVVNDGYAVEFPFYRGEYRLELGSRIFKVTGTGTEDNAVWTIKNDRDIAFFWPDPVPFISADGEIMFRMYIPNYVLESSSDGTNSVTISVFKGESTTAIFRSSINLWFAPAANGLIRSARHLDNIDKIPGGTYVQQLNVDFSIYCKEITNQYTADTTAKLPTAQSVVSGIFNGNYNGNGKYILNVTVNEAANYVGLFARNSGTISNVIMQNANITGANYVGCIAGENTGLIEKAGVNYSIVKGGTGNNTGGISGYNTGSISDVYFLSTKETDNSPVSNNGGGIVGNNQGTVTKAIYLAPAPRETSGPNTIIYPIVRIGNHGEKTDDGADDTCFYLSGNRYSINEGGNWINDSYNYTGTTQQLRGGGRGLVTNFIDKDWIRYAYHVDLTNWYQPSRGYPYPSLTNMPVPGKWPQTDSPARPDQADREDWAPAHSTSNRAQVLNFINSEFELPLMDPNNPNIKYDLLKPGGIWVNPGNPPCISAVQGFYGDYHHDWVQGWSTRPVDPADYANVWHAMDFLEPLANAQYGCVRTNYEGKVEGNYAELNAWIPGTLYQICPTIPGTELYYSFYHAARNSNAIDYMNFYLSGMTDKNGTWGYSNGTGSPTIIRPCTTKRGNATGIPLTRDSIMYGNVSFYDPAIKGTRSAYLYDVWLNNPGYGITFWSATNVALGNSYNNIADLPNAGTFKADAQNNIVGYWDVRYFSNLNRISEWKQYYGLYTIPNGQISTEFAYESKSGEPSGGNFLDGVTFESPSFLSINKFIKMGNEDIKFVKPEDRLTVNLSVKNWGEVTADNIIITDRLSPFDAYISYVANSVRVNGTAPPVGTVITPPSMFNNQTLTITLPAANKLAMNEELRITFDIDVKKEVSAQVSTMLYYFKNQAEVSYYDTDYTGYSSANTTTLPQPQRYIKRNASGPDPVEVFIDPIVMSKTVKTVGAASTEPLIDGPFEVELKIKNTLLENNNIVTTGLINDLIPKGFTITDKGNLPDGTIFTANSDGSTRITILDANLEIDKKELIYHYVLSYEGRGYGVTYTNISADYKYMYSDGTDTLSVMLKFPQPVVGIKIKTKSDRFVYNSAGTMILDVLANDYFSEKITDDNYDVSPEVILLDNGHAAAKNADGDYQINNTFYTATLVRSTNQLQFTPKPGAAGSYEFYYQIALNAEKTGGTPERFNLTSNVTKVTVYVAGDDTLVYYEKYEDGDYGFYAKTAHVPQELNDGKPIIESGYCVLSASSGKELQLSGVSVSNIESFDGIYLYKLNAGPIAGLNLLDVKFGDPGNLNLLGKIHPNFAKAVYAQNEITAGDTFIIRTPQQMLLIGLLSDTKNLIFIQELSIDFAGIAVNGGAVVTGEFMGEFDGNGKSIKNLIINAPDTDNGGLFSRNSGIIKNISLESNTNITGRNNVGGIVGYNLGEDTGSSRPAGIIDKCTVTGDLEPDNPGIYINMVISGDNNVGGIAGLNEGIITDCGYNGVSINDMPVLPFEFNSGDAPDNSEGDSPDNNNVDIPDNGDADNLDGYDTDNLGILSTAYKIKERGWRSYNFTNLQISLKINPVRLWRLF